MFDFEAHYKQLPKPLLIFVHHLQTLKRSVFGFLLCVPTSLLAFLLLFLLTYNGFSVFRVHLPTFLSEQSPSEPANFSRENLARENPLLKWSTSSSSMYVVREENAPLFLKTHYPILPKPDISLVKPATITGSNRRTRRVRKMKRKLRSLSSESQMRTQHFSKRIREFFGSGNCSKPRFFMTWISSLNSFGERESFAMESLFKSHPNACLVIVSKTMDSDGGRNRILKPFLEMGFKVTAVSPDYDFVFKDTPAETWYNSLRTGKVYPGEISLGQNLSNLLRLTLLYKYGGVYADTDVIFVKSFLKLKNVIGAQTIDLETGKWSRLNNAVLVFDKNHPLLLEFIKEFALTFNGNKWGHNGPYLVSRVVSRISSQNPEFNFTVLPPPAFYPVDWSRIQSLFSSPSDEFQSKWVMAKLKHIRTESFVVHLWNRQSKRLKIDKGSIIDYIKSDTCVFTCNSSVSSL